MNRIMGEIQKNNKIMQWLEDISINSFIIDNFFYFLIIIIFLLIIIHSNSNINFVSIITSKISFVFKYFKRAFYAFIDLLNVSSLFFI